MAVVVFLFDDYWSKLILDDYGVYMALLRLFKPLLSSVKHAPCVSASPFVFAGIETHNCDDQLLSYKIYQIRVQKYVSIVPHVYKL
jgi:hypothetical protein